MSETAGLETAPRSGRRRAIAVLGTALLVAAVLQVAGANPAVSESTTLIARKAMLSPGLDPNKGIWNQVTAVDVPLTAQQTAYPFGGGTVQSVEVKALHDSKSLFVRLSWDDAARDDRSDSVERFSDAAAVEFPAAGGSSVPSVCMGQAAGGVNIWHWRADSQEGLPESSTDLGNGEADLEVPADDPLYFPARNAGNPLALAQGAVQDLVAEGFGTIGPLEEQAVEGKGVYSDGRWTVVFKRSLKAPAAGHPAFANGSTTDIAFAVWDGANSERNGKKSVSQFVKLELSNDTIAPVSSATILVLSLLTPLVIIAAVIFFRRRRNAATA